VDHLSSSNFSGDTRPYRPLEDVSKALGAPALSDAGQRRVVWQWFMQRIANEPTNRQVHPCFAHQATVVDNAKQKTGRASAAPLLRDRSPGGHCRHYRVPRPPPAANSNRGPDRRVPRCGHPGAVLAVTRRQTALADAAPSSPTSRGPQILYNKEWGTSAAMATFFNGPT